MPARVAYLMSRFPHLPETFILREMTELQAQGWDVRLYPLIRQQQPVIHPEAQDWLPQAHAAPLASRAVIGANLAELARHPARLMRIWARALRENASNLGFLARTLILLPKAVAYAHQMQREGIEHIHAHYATHPALVAWAIHQLTGIPYSITVHAHDIFVCRAMLAPKLRDAEFIVAISEYNRRFLSEAVGSWVEAKTHVVHCGILPELYVSNEKNGPARRANERFEILNIGSLQPYKGHTYLIEACALLKERGVPFRCRIIGGGDQAGLQQLIDARGLREDVLLLGPQDQHSVARLMASADCYVQPSIITPSGKMEGIPVSIMEALAAQRPVVATRISGVPELVRPGDTGYLVPPADAPALADALEHVYTHPSEAARLAASGRELALAEYHLRTNVARLSALFERRFDDARPEAEQPAEMVTLVRSDRYSMTEHFSE